MSLVRTALQRMQGQNETCQRSVLAQPIDITVECNRLAKLSQEFAQFTSFKHTRKLSLDPNKVWRAFEAANYDISSLDFRQIRTLCLWPDSATHSRFVAALSRQPQSLSRTSCLMGLVASYFTRWGQFREQETVEELIRTALRFYQRRNPMLIEYKRLSSMLFRGDSPRIMASKSIENRESPRSALGRLRILGTEFASATMAVAAREFLAMLPPVRSIDEGLGHLNYATTGVLVEELQNEAFYAGMSSLILCDWLESYPECRDRLRKYVLSNERLGDPRLQPANWATMHKEATARFLQWIAKDSIVFFFNHVLPENSANRRRKDFWLNYARSIQDFQVALSDLHYRQLHGVAGLDKVPGFARLNHSSTSAFIMRFATSSGADITIVEFSETGNAAHVFNSNEFEKNAGSLRRTFFSFSSLKHEPNGYRILHHDMWEYSARQKLAKWGIRP
jgi:hypothetical protein